MAPHFRPDEHQLEYEDFISAGFSEAESRRMMREMNEEGGFGGNSRDYGGRADHGHGRHHGGRHDRSTASGYDSRADRGYKGNHGGRHAGYTTSGFGSQAIRGYSGDYGGRHDGYTSPSFYSHADRGHGYDRGGRRREEPRDPYADMFGGMFGPGGDFDDVPRRGHDRHGRDDRNDRNDRNRDGGRNRDYHPRPEHRSNPSGGFDEEAYMYDYFKSQGYSDAHARRLVEEIVEEKADPRPTPSSTSRRPPEPRRPNLGHNLRMDALQSPSAKLARHNEIAYDIDVRHKKGFGKLETLGHGSNDAKARDLLRWIRSELDPILRRHGWYCPVLKEFYDYDNKGVNLIIGFPGGRQLTDSIMIGLRNTDHYDTFLSKYAIMKTMLHELAHFVHVEHDDAFEVELAKIKREYLAMYGRMPSSHPA